MPNSSAQWDTLLWQVAGWLALVAASAQAATAQSFSPSAPSKEYIRFNGQIVATENWVGLTRIAVGFDGTLWGLDSQGRIYQYVPNQGWNQIPGSLAQIVIGSSSSVWGMNSGGYTYHYVNGSFQNVPGVLVQMAVGSDGDTWGLNSATSIYHYNGSGWAQVPGNLVRIAVGYAGAVYGINSAGSIYHYNTSTQTFQQFTTGSATQISAGQDGDVWDINSAGYRYHYSGGTWWQMATSASQISVGSGNNAWYISGNGTVSQCNAASCTATGSGFSFVGAGASTAFGVSGTQVYQYASGSWNALPELLAWFRKQLDGFRLFQIPA